MTYSVKDIEHISDHAGMLLRELNGLTVAYLSNVKPIEHSPLIVQGAMGIYMKNILEATIYSMVGTRKDKINFLASFTDIMIQTINEIDVDKITIKDKE